MFKIGWGHRTFQLRLYGQMFKLGWGHRTFHLRVSGDIFNQENPYGWVGGWMGGWFFQEIIPLRGSILQVGTCQILSFHLPAALVLKAWISPFTLLTDTLKWNVRCPHPRLII